MKGWFKRGAGLLLLVIFPFCLSGCGEVKEAEAAVQGMFAAFQALDFEGAETFADMDSIADLETKEGGILQPKLLMEALFDELDYNINSSEKKDGKTVLVSTEVTAVDMTALVNAWLPGLFQSMFDKIMDGEQPAGEDLDQKMIASFLEIANQEGNPTAVRRVDIPVVYRDGVWRVEADEVFVDALMGGLNDAAKTITEAFDI